MTADDVFTTASDADVAEQHRSVRGEVPDEEATVTGPPTPPAESTYADWQEQNEALDPDPDFDEFGRSD